MLKNFGKLQTNLRPSGGVCSKNSLVKLAVQTQSADGYTLSADFHI